MSKTKEDMPSVWEDLKDDLTDAFADAGGLAVFLLGTFTLFGIEIFSKLTHGVFHVAANLVFTASVSAITLFIAFMGRVVDVLQSDSFYDVGENGEKTRKNTKKAIVKLFTLYRLSLMTWVLVSFISLVGIASDVSDLFSWQLCI